MPKQNVDDSVSLFPFLSILACVIGILVLMIAAIALGQIGQDTPNAEDAEEVRKQAEEAQARVAEYRALRVKLQADQKTIEALRRLIEQHKDTADELDKARMDFASLQTNNEAMMKDYRESEEEFRKHQEDLTRLTKQIEQLEKQLEPLRENRKELTEELAERKEPPKEAQVVIQPSGSGQNLKPTFIECAGATIVLHDGPKPVRIPRAKLADDPAYMAVLEKVKETDKGRIVFLIRPDGVYTYTVARNIARQNYVQNGKLAIGGQGELDLSKFIQ